MNIKQFVVISSFFVLLSGYACAGDQKPKAEPKQPSANTSQQADAQDAAAAAAASIEPAAGGDTSPCWEQVAGKAAHGIRATLQYGDTVESQLAGAAACGKAAQ